MPQEIYRKERYIDAMIALGLVLLAALLYLPFLGSYPLWDPWEAHYSQVAMEMIHHNTWWEPWYRKSTTSFWSKPILTFWLMISSLKTFRIDQVGSFAQAEFYLRLPIALMGATGVAFMFFFARRLWNRRTGVLAALVLATCPQYFLISRQIMVDIPFVVIQTIALGFFALGIFDPRPETDDEQERTYGVRLFRNLALIALGIQVAEWVYWRFRLLPALDLNNLLSLNAKAWWIESGYWQLTMQQGSYLWLAFALFFFVWMFVRANVLQPKTRFFFLFFFVSGLGFLAKGLLSIVIPGGAVLWYILLTRDWDLLRRMRLFYYSDKIKGSTALFLGIVSALAAVWFITYPMMSSLLTQPVSVAKKRHGFAKWKRHEKEHTLLLKRTQFRTEALRFQSNRTPAMDQVRKNFEQMVKLHKSNRPAQAQLELALGRWRKAHRVLRSARRQKRSAAVLAQLKKQVDAANLKVTQLRQAASKTVRSIQTLRSSILRTVASVDRASRKAVGLHHAHNQLLKPLSIKILALKAQQTQLGKKHLKAQLQRQAQRLEALASAIRTQHKTVKLSLTEAKRQADWQAFWRKRIRVEQQLQSLFATRAAKREKLASRSIINRNLIGYNVLKSIQDFYRNFTRKNLYQQVGWFTLFFFGFLGVCIVLSGISIWEGVKALLLGIPVYVVLFSQSNALGQWFVAQPILGALVVYFAMTPVVFQLGRRQQTEAFKRLFFASGILVGIASLPAWSEHVLASMSFVPALLKLSIHNLSNYSAVIHQPVYAAVLFGAIFTLLFAVLTAVLGSIFDTFGKENFAPYRTSVIRLYVILLTIGVFAFLRIEALHTYTIQVKMGVMEPATLKGFFFGPQLLLALLMVFSLLVLSVLFSGEAGRERAKAYLCSGALIYLIVAGSWVYVMDLKHGLRFMKEWFIYHHFQRLQGVIEKPNNTFDLYVKQIAFGMFPWSALLPIAVIRLLRWNWKDIMEVKSRRNLFFFMCFFFPYVFFTFSSTKFHHYIFPVVPFLALFVGIWLARLFREDGIAKDRIGVAASLMLFALLAKDLMTNYKPLHQLFTYYTMRTTPAEVYPRNTFLLLFALFGLIFLTILLVRRLRYVQFGLLMVPVVLFVMYVNVRLIPAVAPNFSFKSLWTTFQDIDDERILKDLNGKRLKALKAVKHKVLQKPVDDAFQQAARNVKNNREMRRICRTFRHDIIRNSQRVWMQYKLADRSRLRVEAKRIARQFDPCSILVRRPFGEFANWDERSTSFYSNNFNVHIGKSWKAKPFLRKHRSVFIMVDRHKLPTLRAMAKRQKRKIYIIARPNYKMWLVSTSPNKGKGKLGSIVLNQKPNLNSIKWKRVNVQFGDKVRLVAVGLNKPNGYRRGDKVRITFLFKCLKKMPRNWKVFIHADPVTWTRNRLNWDHLMADGLYPTTEWKPGQYVQDIVERTLPRNYPAHYNRLHIYMGLWRGNSRLPIRSSTVYHDGQNRVRSITLKLLP